MQAETYLMPQIRNLGERHFPESETEARLFSNRRSLVRQKQGGFQSRSHLETLCLPNGNKTAKHKLKGLFNANKTAKHELKGLSNGNKTAKHELKGQSNEKRQNFFTNTKQQSTNFKFCPMKIRQQSTNLKVCPTEYFFLFLILFKVFSHVILD